MKTFPIYLKTIFLFLAFTVLASCESEPINEEIGIHEQEKYGVDKEDVQIPGEK